MAEYLLTAHRRAEPASLRVGGLWGRRLRDTVTRWMLHVDEDALLDGFRHRPGVQPWIGEHVGKFLLGAIATGQYLGRPDLQAKVRRLVEELVTHQEADGYLGTYLPPQRWQPGEKRLEAQTPCWDLWVHKYAILALLAYYEVTNWEPALTAARRAGDLVTREFGPASDRDLNRTDEHAGLASGSILEAIVLLHRRTGEPRYLEFAQRIVTYFWEREDGPRIMPSLRQGNPIHTIGDGKAYEMMSCFVGLTEYGRSTGDRGLLDLLLAARDRIADGLRHPTGGMSDVEWFKAPGVLREEAPLETCVSFTWIQWNLRLFEATADPQALDLAEETAWNQILPAVCPDGSTWTYHLPTTGPKHFARTGVQGVAGRYGGAALTCCHTNGQRALALFPRYAFTSAGAELAVNLYHAGAARVTLADGRSVTAILESDFPRMGTMTIEVRPESDEPVSLALRLPAWCEGLRIDGRDSTADTDRRVRVTVRGQARLRLELEMPVRLLVLGGYNRGKVALARGPLVFALDRAPQDWPLEQVALRLDPTRPPTSIAVSVGPDGWPILEVPVSRMPAAVVAPSEALNQAPPGVARLEPILFAGLAGNPRWARPDQDDAPWTDEATVGLPTYRTAFPWICSCPE